MQVNLKIASVARETGALLTEYLTDRGLTLKHNRPDIPTICYGIPSSNPQSLNGNCGGGDKIRRLNQMKAGGVRTVPWFAGSEIPIGFKFPALARAVAGHGGEDIVPVFQPQEVEWRVKAGFAWFSSYIPLHTEYRIWNFRGETLGVYEKVMRRPEDYKFVAGRNFRQGFDFEKVPDDRLVPLSNAMLQAANTIKALSFDFGAVDILWGMDGYFYVLECNTAIGAIKSKAHQTLAKLADRMVEWAESGCPERGY